MVMIPVCKYRHCDWNIDWWTPIYWWILAKFGRQLRWCCVLCIEIPFFMWDVRGSLKTSQAQTNQPTNEQTKEKQPTKDRTSVQTAHASFGFIFIANQIESFKQMQFSTHYLINFASDYKYICKCCLRYIILIKIIAHCNAMQCSRISLLDFGFVIYLT